MEYCVALRSSSTAYSDAARKRAADEYALADTFCSNPFSVPGDSVPFVCDNSGSMIILLIGGAERKYNSYFTPPVSVFIDIKHPTGAARIRILEETTFAAALEIGKSLAPRLLG